jgi:hypothetical protein
MSKLKFSHDPGWGLGTRTPEGQMKPKAEILNAFAISQPYGII